MLVNCPECGREGVSDQAQACPDCAFPIEETPNEELTRSSTTPSRNSESTQTPYKTAHAKIHFVSAFNPGTWTFLGWLWAIMGGLMILVSPVAKDMHTASGLITGVAFLLYTPFIRYFADQSFSLFKQCGICFLILILAGLAITYVDPDRSLDSDFEFKFGSKIDMSPTNTRFQTLTDRCIS